MGGEAEERLLEDRLPALKPVTGVHTWPPCTEVLAGTRLERRQWEFHVAEGRGQSGWALALAALRMRVGLTPALPGAESYLGCWTLGIGAALPCCLRPAKPSGCVSWQAGSCGESGGLPGERAFLQESRSAPGQEVRSISQLRLIYDACPSSVSGTV